MVKSLKTDRINGVADVEIHKDELKNTKILEDLH